MSELSDKILRSGLIDKHTAALMERYGLIEAGDVEKVPEGSPLANATKQQLTKFADELSEIVEREAKLKESYLDLEKLRWPAQVRLEHDLLIEDLNCMVDRMGRYYFRPSDVQLKWFVPGRILKTRGKDEIIIEAQELFIGDVVAAVQVSTRVQ